MKIFNISFGYRGWDGHRWKDYLLPKAYINKSYGHEYFLYYYRWLNFFWCKPRKCEACGKLMDGRGGVIIWSHDGNHKRKIICRTCCDNHTYVSSDGYRHDGYCAWLNELWDEELRLGA